MAWVVRVMSYNIFMGGRRGRAVDDVVRAAGPDVLLVNEAPKEPFLSVPRCRRLARRWGLKYVVGGRSAGSNMIAVKPPVTVLQARAERIAQPRWQPRRGVAAAQLQTGEQTFGVVSCHLSLDRQRRRGEVELLLRAADRLSGPVVLAGDLNEAPGGPCWRLLGEAGFVDHGDEDHRTFPADSPTRRVDALLLRGAAVLRHGPPALPDELLAAASDHRPVLGDVVLHAPSGGGG